MSSEPPAYWRREWLNPEGHPSSGSVFAWVGMKYWGPEEGRDHLEPFFEISDCAAKVRLHDTIECDEDAHRFIAKLRLLSEIATEAADALERELNEGRAFKEKE